ncbi:XRE family transcriptional regulator [Pseudoalteromonas sp. J010]|uniref:helix-turn-helix domain-containing protein n=1 Tax=Pseudoalteromonas sp. J010 TaxID=998465 RepID=UPI000F6530D6|nr:helix-turn-helix transcriptional regulator [Pseudoalteromonas sp. J010]RRS09331.1 XRE family transcriptional regulator [Pseudoalteromonas sp. J010]
MQTPEEYEVSQRVGLLIQGLKHRRGMSKERICRHLDISTRTLDNYLSGASSFKLGTLLKFADLCRVRLADILDDTEELLKLNPDSFKDKGNILALLMSYVVSAVIFEPITCVLLFILVYLARKDTNSFLLISIFTVVLTLDAFLVFCLKIIVFPKVESFYIENILAYGVQLITSLMLLLSIKYKMTISLLLTRARVASVFEKNYVESPLYFLTGVLVLVDFLALMENFVRNMERLGVAEETAKTFWNLTFFFDNYSYLKAFPILLCISLLYIGFLARSTYAVSPQRV